VYEEEIMIINKIDFVDKVLTCLDCGREFTFASAEQRYFWAKGLSEPKRCKPCRIIRRRSIVTIEEEHNENNRRSW
jgi:ribosomal protein L36